MNASPAPARAMAWTGAGLFAASLGYFLFSYEVTFGVTTERGPAGGAVAIDVALFSAFALHHSLFARERVRARVTRLVSPALERSVYVWAASLMLAAVCWFWRPVPGVAWEASGGSAWLLRAIQLIGVWVTLRAAAIIDVWDLAGVRQVRSPSRTQPPIPESERDEHGSREPDAGNWQFKTDGPYGWVRHPIYLGWFLLVLATPAMTMTRLVFAVVSCAYILVAIPFEERSLIRSSGGAYESYCRRVRWKLVPFVL